MADVRFMPRQATVSACSGTIDDYIITGAVLSTRRMRFGGRRVRGGERPGLELA